MTTRLEIAEKVKTPVEAIEKMGITYRYATHSFADKDSLIFIQKVEQT